MIAGKPLVLIADDDPVSLRFLQGAVEHCGCAVLAAVDGEAALRALSSSQAVDLLLLDRRMPGVDGSALLRAIRKLGSTAPAVATSADIDRATERTLHDAGFAATLHKPATLADVHALLRHFVGIETAAPPRDRVAEPADAPLLDDAAALAAVGGEWTTLRTLRTLFARELADVDDGHVIAESTANSAALAERLHRLRAACGICGALRLRHAADRLESALQLDPARAEAAARDFVVACRATREALAVEQEREVGR